MAASLAFTSTLRLSVAWAEKGVWAVAGEAGTDSSRSAERRKSKRGFGNPIGSTGLFRIVTVPGIKKSVFLNG
jgi:hypothetical protein